MATYRCLILEANGKKKKIDIKADSKNLVQEKLKREKKTVLSIEEVGTESSKDIKKVKRFSKRDLSIFCRQLQAMLTAGLPISDCFEILGSQLDNKNLRIVVKDINKSIMRGYTLTEAVNMHSDLFPEVFIHMIHAGEISGNLDGSMDRLATQFEKDYKLESKVKNALVYPVILAVLSITVVVFLLVFVLPTFMDIYTSSNAELPFITQIFINMSNFLRNQWYIVVAVITAIVITRRLMLQNEKVLINRDRRRMGTPVLGKLRTQAPTALFARTMSTLLGSGVSLLQALDITSRVVGNEYIASKLLFVKDEVSKGKTLSGPLRETSVFPDMLPSMVKIGEDSGTLEEILNKTADYYEMEVDNAVSRLTAMLEPIMIVFMAVIVGFIIIAMILPMFDMMNIVA